MGERGKRQLGFFFQMEIQIFWWCTTVRARARAGSVVGAEAFADALRANKKIRSLHLSHNQIGVTGFRALLDVVKAKGTRHLEQLWLDGNSYDENSRKLRPLVDSMRRQLSKNEQRGMRRRGIKWQQHEL